MEIQLQELIEQIKRDGIAAAECEADELLSSARAEAEKIISNARAEAEAMVLAAKRENERALKSGDEAIRQAGRNLLISFRESVARELDAVISEKINAVYSSEELMGLIIKAVEAISKNGECEDITVSLNKGDLDSLEDALLASLRERISAGVTLKASDSFDGGFRIAAEGGRVYYDYCAQAVVEMLSAYLNPRVAALLKEAEKS